MKVHQSNIPVESGKPHRLSKGRDDYSNFFEDDEEDYNSDNPEIAVMRGTLLNFEEEGLMIPIHTIASIEKDMRFVEKPKGHWEFGISINKNVKTTQFVPKADICIWYNTEEFRDQKWEFLKQILSGESYKVLEL